ncbi:MAG: ABC-F family ATP-binding cassette domain-containing protein [Rhodothalassiaceae bacterium]
MLHINEMTWRIGDRLLFDRATAHIAPGRRIGLIGRNGAGKSTLLAMIAGTLSPESGSLSVRPRASIAMVGQEAPSGARDLVTAVLDAHRELRALEAEAITARDPHRIAEIHTRLADIGAHAAPARAATILAGLGFDGAAQARPLDSFSGGWRMRVALAAALFLSPDLLLLDEPTNYLDLEGVIWLENFLRSYPYTVLLVSHDRSLLNRAVDGILHLEGGKLTLYAGGYDDFARQRLERNERILAMKTRQEAERRHIQAFVDRFRYKASKARQAQSRLKMLERMTPIVGIVEEHTVPFHFPKPDPLSPPLISLEGVSVGYAPDRPVLRNLDLRIDPEDRIALLGANGNGKSTFARLLARRLEPLAGRIVMPRTLRVGYFAQHQIDELHENETPYEHLRALMPDHTEARVRARLGSFGFTADKADRPVSTLSGGEKARLNFALMSFAAPQIMILDEPTNHLDIDSREALMRALNEYDGAVILISHDRHLVEACADRLWIVAEGRIARYDGDMESYRQLLLKERAGRQDSEPASREGSSRKAERRAAADRRQALAPLREAVDEAERRLAELGEKRARAEQALNNPALYDGTIADGPKKAALLQQEIARLSACIDSAEEDWLAAQAELEAHDADLCD